MAGLQLRKKSARLCVQLYAFLRFHLIPVLMWGDENPEKYSNPSETYSDENETMPTFEEFKAAVEEDYLATENTEVSRR